MAGRGKRIQTEMSTSSVNLTAYAILDRSNRTWVTLINKDVTNIAHVTLSCSSPVRSIELVRLASPSFDAKAGTTLAGAEVTPEGHWKPKNIEKMKPTRGTVSLDIQPASAALLKM
jgi:hypothetical protein